MAARMTKCPECNFINVKTLKVHNPDATELNAKASLQCKECEYKWEGAVTSDRTKERRRRGWLR